ncbi:MAG TPA: hypothetical protein VMM12_12965 [Longimicrobiales bacterium]|nr:hypothetical protein [Longimicrobiales bacterium]
MSESVRGLRVVDALELAGPYREALRPGELVRDGAGRAVQLPRYFYEVPTWEAALDTWLSPHFGAFEFLDVDVREAEPLRAFPRYLPCAVVAFAAVLERFREAAGAPVRIAANGGYRSPSHALSRDRSPHLWGAAADIYRIGGDYLDDPERIRRYAELAERAVPGAWARPTGTDPASAFDHLHLDLGYLTRVPRDVQVKERES